MVEMSVLLEKMLIFLVLMVIGYTLAKRGMLDKNSTRAISSLTINVFMCATIIGSGLGKRGSQVNWAVAARMLVAWLVTFPAAGVVGAAACALCKTGIGGTVIAVLAAIAIALGIVRLSQRNPVNAHNVNSNESTQKATARKDAASARIAA